MKATTSWMSFHYMFALKVKDILFQLALRGGSITLVEEMRKFACG